MEQLAEVLKAQNVPKCDVCEKFSLEPKFLKRCAACKQRSYCSKECQLKDWKEGKNEKDEAAPSWSRKTYASVATASKRDAEVKEEDEEADEYEEDYEVSLQKKSLE